MSRPQVPSAVLVLGCLVALCGCATSAEIRVHNISPHDIADLSIAGQPYGDVAAGETSDYLRVNLKLGYAAMKLWMDGRYVTGQTLNMGSNRFTYRIDVKDLAKGHLAIEVVRD